MFIAKTPQEQRNAGPKNGPIEGQIIVTLLLRDYKYLGNEAVFVKIE